MKDIIRQTVVVLTVLATLIVNYLSNALPLNGMTAGQISDKFNVLFVPAGYVFSIWGVIYIGLIAYTIYQALPSQRENPLLRKIGYLVAATGLANIGWLFLWHYQQFAWTLIFMGALLALLIAIYLALGVGRTSVSTLENWVVRIPFRVYLGWITVATIANVTVVLDYFRWDTFGLGTKFWFVIVMGAVLVISSLMSLTRRDIAFALVILWALIGIAVKQTGNGYVPMATLTTAGLVAIILLYSLWRKKGA
jgi:hypothetical protein